jgi:hypothetical protein
MCLSAVQFKSAWPTSEVGQDAIVEGRLYTVFGYDSRLAEFWKRWGFKDYVGRKMFVFNEALSWQDRVYGKQTNTAGQYVTGVSEP